MSKPKKQVEYINMGPWPIFVGYTDCPKAFRRECKRLDPGYPRDHALGPNAAATTHTLHRGDDTIVIVVGRPLDEDEDEPFFLSVLAHEAVHVVQSIRKCVGHNKLGVEAEPYTVQYLVLQMWHLANGGRDVVRHIP